MPVVIVAAHKRGGGRVLPSLRRGSVVPAVLPPEDVPSVDAALSHYCRSPLRCRVDTEGILLASPVEGSRGFAGRDHGGRSSASGALPAPSARRHQRGLSVNLPTSTRVGCVSSSTSWSIFRAKPTAGWAWATFQLSRRSGRLARLLGCRSGAEETGPLAPQSSIGRVRTPAAKSF